MSVKYIDHSGQRFRRLLVVSHAGTWPQGRVALWSCLCDCGNEVVVRGMNLRRGQVKSCGCLHTSGRTASPGTHGGRPKGPKTPTYNSWTSMRVRCNNRNHDSWPNYGGRGITVCTRWGSFENFLADMGERPTEKTLDRIDVNGNYCPENCRWATLAEQAINKRPTRTRLEWLTDALRDGDPEVVRVVMGFRATQPT